MKLKEKMFGKLSSAQKLWIGLGAVILLLALCIAGGWLLKMRLFEKNPRFTLKHVQIEPPTGYVSSYWNSELNRNERCRQLLSDLKLKEEGKQVNLYTLDLQAIHDQTLKLYSEIEKVEISRVLPDTLRFVIHERVPIANIGPAKAPQNGSPAVMINGRKVTRYLDDNGIVMSAERCQNVTLPMIIDMSDRETGKLAPGDQVKSSAIRLALDFISLVTTNPAYKDIVIRTILLVEYKNSIQCNIRYKIQSDNNEYVVILPYPISKEKLRIDIMGRLIPALEKLRLRKEDKFTINLQFEGQAVIKAQNK